MNLLELAVKIGVEDNASAQMDSISAGMIAKGELIAQGIANAMAKAAQAIQSFFGSAIDAYGNFEQLQGGMQTLFGSAADTVIANSKRAYETAGMSANQYMQNASQFAVSLIDGVVKRRSAANQQMTSDQQAALSSQTANVSSAMGSQTAAHKAALQAQTTNMQRAFQDQEQALADSLQSQITAVQRQQDRALDAYRRQLDKQVKAQEEANRELVEQRRDELDEEYRQLEKSLDAEVDAYQKATDQKIKEIDREYTERLKLLDEEEYNRIKAIEDQMDALDAQTEAERKAIKNRENERRAGELREEAQTALYREDREKAERQLSDLMADIAQDEREDKRRELKKGLSEQKEALRKQYSERKSQIKEAQAAETEAYREQRKNELKEMKESHAQILEQKRDENEKNLKEYEKGLNAEIEALRERNADEIREMQYHNQDVITQMQKDAQARLQEMQRAHQDELAQAKANAEEIANASSDTLSGESLGYADATDEDLMEAAKLTDMAMQDMSDNANTFGTDMGRITDAYRGMSMGNFTMLDNLRLGYKGTTAEMQRLLRDAEKVKASNGEMAHYSIDNFSDMVEAIHVMQESMGISGKTAEEASGTVQGSIGRVAAAWDNFLISLGDPDGDVDKSLDDLMVSIDGALDNLIPLIGRILDRVVELVKQRGPEIAETLWNSIKDAIPEEDREEFAGVIASIEAIGRAAGGLAQHAPAILTFVAAFSGLQTVASLVSTVTTLLGGGAAAGGAAAAAGAGGAAAAGAAGAAGGGLLGALGSLAAVVAPAAGLALGIGALVGTLGYLVDSNDEARQAVNDFVTDVDHLSTDTQLNTASMSDAWKNVYNDINTSVTDSAAAVDVQTAGMSQSVSNTMESIDSSASTTSESFGISMDTLSTRGQDAMDNLSATFSAKTGLMDTDTDVTTSSMTSKWGSAWTDMETKAKNGSNNVVTTASGMKTSITTNFEHADTWLANAGTNIINGFVNAAVAAWNATRGFFSRIGDWIRQHKGPESYDRRLLVPAGQSIMFGFMRGIENTFNRDVKPYVSGIAGDVAGLMDFGGVSVSPFGSRMTSAVSAGQLRQSRDMTVILEVDGMQFARTVYRANDEETQRVGARFSRRG